MVEIDAEKTTRSPHAHNTSATDRILVWLTSRLSSNSCYMTPAK